MIKFLAFTALFAVAWLGGSWFLMITVGIVHARWIPQLPTLGFQLALLLGAITIIRQLLGAIVGAIGKAVGGDKG